jgi:hypothetical protein
MTGEDFRTAVTRPELGVTLPKPGDHDQDPSATLAVHCGNSFVPGLSPIKVLI